MEPIRSICTDDVLGALEQPGAPGRTRGGAGEELRKHLLRLADEEEIDELGERLRVEKDGGAARQHERRGLPARLASQRQPGECEDIEHVQVVGLERDREREDVEVAERPVALERAQGPRPPRARAVGQERALDGDPRVVVQDA